MNHLSLEGKHRSSNGIARRIKQGNGLNDCSLIAALIVAKDFEEKFGQVSFAFSPSLGLFDSFTNESPCFDIAVYDI